MIERILEYQTKRQINLTRLCSRTESQVCVFMKKITKGNSCIFIQL